MVESKVVYDTFEDIMQQGAVPYCEWVGESGRKGQRHISRAWPMLRAGGLCRGNFKHASTHILPTITPFIALPRCAALWP
jgi:hypothetical protein